MTTPLIPIKTILTATKYTPAELLADAAFENYLLDLPNSLGSQFIRALMTAYRTGNGSFTFMFNSFEVASYMAGQMRLYGYEVTDPVVGPPAGKSITVTLT